VTTKASGTVTTVVANAAGEVVQASVSQAASGAGNSAKSVDVYA
jgi:hypothetical protein